MPVEPTGPSEVHHPAEMSAPPSLTTEKKTDKVAQNILDTSKPTHVSDAEFYANLAVAKNPELGANKDALVRSLEDFVG